MDENLEIIQKIMLLGIKLDKTQDLAIEFYYHSASGKLTVSVCTNRNVTFNDGMTIKWWISVKNTELLKVVLKELESLESTEESALEEDFLG